jgi:hypothetical protein
MVHCASGGIILRWGCVDDTTTRRLLHGFLGLSLVEGEIVKGFDVGLGWTSVTSPLPKKELQESIRTASEGLDNAQDSTSAVSWRERWPKSLLIASSMALRRASIAA